MGVKNLQIIFDHPTAVFMTGDKITGQVIIVVSNDIKIKSKYSNYMKKTRLIYIVMSC